MVSFLPLQYRRRHKEVWFLAKIITFVAVTAFVLYFTSGTSIKQSVNDKRLPTSFSNSFMSMINSTSIVSGPENNTNSESCILPADTSYLCEYVRNTSSCNSNQYTLIQYCSFGPRLQSLYYVMAVSVHLFHPEQ